MNEGDEVKMEAGVHRFEFSCHLPEQLPESVELRYGSVKYFVEVVLEVPWGFNQKHTLPFTVMRHEIPESPLEATAPQTFDFSKHFSHLFSDPEPLSITIKIPNYNFMPGQRIPIGIEYGNESSVKVTQTRIKLQRLVTLKSQRPENTLVEKKNCLERVEKGVSAYTSTAILSEIALPSKLKHSTGSLGTLIQIEYVLSVKAIVGGLRKNAKVKIPIVIGMPSLQAKAEVSGPENAYQSLVGNFSV